MIICESTTNVPGLEHAEITLDELENNLWATLAGDTRVCRSHRPISGFPLLTVIDEANDSQFDVLMEAFRSGVALPPQGAAIALRGKKFHGHHGRPWLAAAGNIHLTAWFTTELSLLKYQAALTMLPALAAWSTVKQLCPDAKPGIKWVNDILIDGKKVSGVITSTQSRKGVAERVVYGIGLNVAVAPEADPTSYVPSTGCIADYGQVDFWAGLDVLLGELARWHRVVVDEGPCTIYQSYTAHSLIVGREVSVMDDPGDQQEIARGLVTGINPDLSLSIKGVHAPVRTGRLKLI